MNIQYSALSLQTLTEGVAFDLCSTVIFDFLYKNSIATQLLLLPHAATRLLQYIHISQN